MLCDLAVRGSTVVDIGANVGFYTIPLAKHVGLEGCVIAFEPDPDNFTILCRNLLANRLNNVVPHRLALGAHAGPAMLYQSGRNRGMLSLCRGNVERSDVSPAPIHVDLAVADDLLQSVTNLSLVKIDVEGAEALVIRGMRETLKQHPDATIVFEFSAAFIRGLGQEPEDLLTDLHDVGYDLAVVDEKRKAIRKISRKDLLYLTAEWGQAVNVIAKRTC